MASSHYNSNKTSLIIIQLIIIGISGMTKRGSLLIK